MKTDISRRQLVRFGLAATVLGSGGGLFAQPSPAVLSPAVRRQALAALEKHRSGLLHVDRIGIVDFTRPSSAPRLFILDTASGAVQPHLVAHGRGSDPTHTGWALRFSNEPGSLASSSGAYATGAEYVGKHGRSMRVSGLDPENTNAQSRAIVIHAAAYVGPQIVAQAGKLGRSQGCFAVSDASLGDVLGRLGAGRLLYAAKA
jgi:hypothetical protein